MVKTKVRNMPKANKSASFPNSYVLSKFIMDIADIGGGKHCEEAYN